MYKTNTLRNLTAGDELVVHELVHVLSNEQDNYIIALYIKHYIYIG